MGSGEKTREKEIYRTTFVGGVVNLLLLLFKFVAGFVGHSSAMIADAVHSLSDFLTDIVVVVFVKISGKPQDEDHGYGHGKYETLATAIIGLLLLAVGVGILVESVKSIVAFCGGGQLEAPGMVAFVAAAVSVVLKELLYRYTIFKGKRLNSKAVVANAWHHRSDAFSSIGVLVGIGGSLLLGEEWRVLDPIAAAVVSIFIIKVAVDLVKPCLDELLEKSLPKELEDRITAIILSFPQVGSPHHLRTRYIGNNVSIEVHVRMDGTISLNEAHEVTKRIEVALKAEFGNGTYISIHMEPFK